MMAIIILGFPYCYTTFIHACSDTHTLLEFQSIFLVVSCMGPGDGGGAKRNEKYILSMISLCVPYCYTTSIIAVLGI